MSAFQAVNTSLTSDSRPRSANPFDDKMAATPRPTTAPAAQQRKLSPSDEAATPTRATFGALAGQKPLPESPFPAAVTLPETKTDAQRPASQSGSQTSSKARDSQEMDVDMDGSDDGNQQHDDGSDGESVTADGKSNKKKKSQRFWCTDYPPCNLSFTRSEHLARHIRKHTGERPFQCHCSRRFSRLDNLRQHAQTVHVNEEIPTDSLAATGTRFQRQVRTERVPRSNNRARASTAGSQTPGRGHTRNALSASSITSISSTFSNAPDLRRRPPPLVMASDPRNRLSMEGYPVDPASGPYPAYRPQSPGGYGTPTSATFSTGQHSPRWGPSLQSPISSHSRTVDVYNGHRTPGRRLSVPSGVNPFQSPHGYGQPPMTPLTTNQSVMSPASSMLPSPTTSTSGSTWSRRDSISSSDEAWRRRTWHPETYSTFSSRLANVSTPGSYEQATPRQPQLMQAGPAVATPPSVQPQPSAQTTRLPGIESFDPLRRPATPPRRVPSPMMVDSPSRSAATGGEQYGRMSEDRKSMPQWDMGLHRNLTRLEIAQSTPPSDSASAWASEANRAVQAQAEKVRTGPTTVRFEQPPYIVHDRPPRAAYMRHQHTFSAPNIPTHPSQDKRQGWYNAPVSPRLDALRHRTSPEGSSGSEGNAPGTPGSASYTYSYSRGADAPTEDRKMVDNNMLRLETLVAVATSEDNATTAY